mgnify:CR=1 FL=1
MTDYQFINGIPTKCFISDLPTKPEPDSHDDCRYSVTDDKGNKYTFQFENGFRPSKLINQYKNKLWGGIRNKTIKPKDIADKELITVDSLERFIKENWL